MLVHIRLSIAVVVNTWFSWSVCFCVYVTYGWGGGSCPTMPSVTDLPCHAAEKPRNAYAFPVISANWPQSVCQTSIDSLSIASHGTAFAGLDFVTAWQCDPAVYLGSISPTVIITPQWEQTKNGHRCCINGGGGGVYLPKCHRVTKCNQMHFSASQDCHCVI